MKTDRLKAFLYVLAGMVPLDDIEFIMSRIQESEAWDDKEIVYANKHISNFVDDLISKLVGNEMVHHVKCWPEFYQALAIGQKSFEIRKNDRAYKVDDSLFIEEWDPETKRYTGR